MVGTNTNKSNRSYNGDRDVTLSTEMDTNSSSAIYQLNAVQQHSFGNTSPSSTLFIAAFFNTTLRWIFNTQLISPQVFFNQVRQNTLQKLVLIHARSATFLAQKMLVFHRISVDVIQRFLVILLTKPRTKRTPVLGYPTHKTSPSLISGSWLPYSQNLALQLGLRPNNTGIFIAACKGNPTDASQRTPSDIRTIK